MVQDHSGERQGCIMSPWLLNEYMDAVIKNVKEEKEVNEGVLRTC